MEAKLIDGNKTLLRCHNKKESFLIEKLKFIGAKPADESDLYTYFIFNGDILTTSKYLDL